MNSENMNIIYFLLHKFFQEEKFNIVWMILNSFILNILQTNGISYITAAIITSLQQSNQVLTYDYFKWFIILSILFILLYNAYKYYQNKLLTKLRQWMRHHLVEILLQVNNENFSEINFTKLNSPINRISSVSFMVFNDMITYLLPNITFLLIVSAYFLYKNTIFGVGFIIGNICWIAYGLYNMQDMVVQNENYEKNVNETESYLIDILNNMDKIVYRGQTDSEINTFSQKTNNSIDAALAFYSNTNYHGTVMTIIVFLILFVSLGYLIHLFFNKEIAITIFITFFTILLLYREKMMIIIQQMPDFIEFLGRSDSVLKHFKNMDTDYLSVQNKMFQSSSVSTTNMPRMDHIVFQDVTFQYTTNLIPVFEHLNLSIYTENKIIGITGLSGNGKSTFAKLLLKMYQPKSGRILIDGIDIQNIDTNTLRKQIVYVNQTSKLFDKKIIDNVLYGCNDLVACQTAFKEIMKYPKIRELFRNVDFYKKGSGALGENLSGGQRQIVNIIGGLVNPSKILILDEPTNALDSELKKELLELIKDMKPQKKCIIIITHDSDVFSLMDERIQI